MTRILRLPFLVVLMGIGAGAMLLPAGAAYVVRDPETARTFLFSASLVGLASVLLGVATVDRRRRDAARSHLLSLLGAFTLLPLVLALPVYEALPGIGALDAWFEMVTSLTTTGATVLDPEATPAAVHLWRALVGWLGGFLIWTTAIAVLAPLNLGGFEVTSASGVGRRMPLPPGGEPGGDTGARIFRYAAKLAPIYAALTGVLAVLLLMLGDPLLVAVCHAMSTLSTSAITPLAEPSAAPSGRLGEAAIFLFLLFALSRQTFTLDFQPESVRALGADPELRMGLLCALVVPVLVFLRHWVGAVEGGLIEGPVAALRALWGGLFTVLSFLTTTGFESADWRAARLWSGLDTPGLLLAGLAIIGGGVATTAGGVKLLRVYALYKHGSREMAKLVHPSSVGGAGALARRIRSEGAYIAWIFFMLFALSVALVMVVLALVGLDFETALVLTVAALSTTGPLAGVAADPAISYATLGAPAKLILAGAMVLGRLETLAIIALLNPEIWRS